MPCHSYAGQDLDRRPSLLCFIKVFAPIWVPFRCYSSMFLFKFYFSFFINTRFFIQFLLFFPFYTPLWCIFQKLKLFMTSNRILELIKRVLIHKCRCIYKRYKIRRLLGIRRPRLGMCIYGLVAAQPPHHHGLVGRTLKRGTFLPGYRTIHGEDADSSWIRVYCATFFSWIFLDFLIQNNNRGLPNLS